MKKLTIVAFLLVCIAFTASAQVAGPVALDMPPVQITNVSNGSSISVRASNRGSYCCSVIRTGGDSTAIEFSSTSNFSGVEEVVARGVEHPSVRNSNNRWCWIDGSSSAGLYNGARGLVFGSISTTTTANVWCEETTLYGNYNTSVSELNYLEITGRTGNTAATIKVKVRLKSSVTGTERTSDLTISLNSQTGDTIRRDVAIHELVGNTADFGDIKITHDGAPGQVSAKLSQYDITSTNPFNFVLVGQEVLKRGTSR